MVLIFLLSILGLQNGGSDLFELYEKELNKQVEKVFESDNLSYKNVNNEAGELMELIEGNEKIGYLYIAEVASCHLGGCSFLESTKVAESEYFDLMVLLNIDQKIIKIKILDYFSDYGYEVTSKKYLKKFMGLTPCDFSTQQDGVDSVSGATISSYALEGNLALLCGAFDSE